MPAWSGRSLPSFPDMGLKERYWKFRRDRIKRAIRRGERCDGGELPLRYYLERHASRDLVVVYSAFPEHGKPASYNYVFALSRLKVNKLFLLDEYGPDGAGCYYLGGTLVRQAEALVDSVRTSLCAERVFHVGSSKGGWAALYFGLRHPADRIVIGGPQYYLGTYLSAAMPNLYTFIAGEAPTEAGIARLDALLPDRVRSAQPRPIRLHYSDREHTYSDSVLPLIGDLNACGYPVECDVAHYAAHGEIGLYFAEYLPKALADLLRGGGQ